jgi:hypothetical protein
MIPVFDQNLDKEATLRDIFIYLTAPIAYDQRGVDAGEALDDQTCYRCRGDNSINGNEMLLCDTSGCDAAWHVRCCGLNSVPQADWFCPRCDSHNSFL